MNKFTLLVGAGVGFVLGSKVGHGPYELLESKVRQVAERPQVQGAVDQVKTAAKQKVGDKLPISGGHHSHETLTPEELEAELSAPG